MKLIQCRYSSCHARADRRCGAVAHACPLHLRSTQAKVPRGAIQAFYSYAKSRDLNMACHLESILALLDGYAIWLQAAVKPTTWLPESAQASKFSPDHCEVSRLLAPIRLPCAQYLQH